LFAVYGGNKEIFPKYTTSALN